MQFCRFYRTIIKILIAFFTKTEKNHKIYMEPEKSLDNQNSPQQKNNAGGIIIPHFKYI